MPDLSAYAANYRADGYKPRLLLSFLDGASCLVGAVTADQADGDLNIAYTTSSGNSANVRPGMRVVVRTSGGAYKGTLSVRYAGTISSTNLPVREYSMGEVQVVTGDVFTVYEDLVLVDKLVSGEQSDGTITFSPDYQTYTDQNDLYRPATCSGSWGVCKLDASGNGDIAYQGNESWHVDPDSPSIPSPHAWSATGSPTFAVGSSTTQSVTLRWTTAGKYTVTHTTTDASNATTWTQYVRARVHDDNDPPMELSIDQVSGDAVNGFSFTVNVYEDATFVDVPDGMPVILWSEDTIDGGVTRGAKFASRSNIVASGFLRRDESFPNASPNTVKFEIISPLAMLSELPGFSKILQEVVSPDEWSEFTDLTTTTAAVNLLRYYTNALDQFDLVRDQYSPDNYPRFELEKQTPIGQQNELATSRMARFTVDRTGRFELQGELWAVDLDDRANVTKTFTFTTDDVIAGTMTLKRDHVRPLETFRLRGVSASTADSSVVNPVFARFPATPARGNQVVIQEKAIVVDDGGVDLYDQCSKRAAWVNGVLFLATGEQIVAPELSVQFPLVYARMFQNYREYFGFNFVAADSGGREIALSLFDWIFVSITEDYQALTCTVNFRAATYAPPGASVDDTPKSDVLILPPNNPPVDFPPITTPTPEGGLKRNTRVLAFVGSDGYLYITNDFNSPSPTWVRYNISASGTMLMAVQNAFSTGDLMLVTTTHAHTYTDIWSARTLGAGYALRYTTDYRTVQTERGFSGVVCINSHDSAGAADNGNDIDISLNFGTSWTQYTGEFGTWVGGAGDNHIYGIHVSPHTSGLLIAGAPATAGGTTARTWKSTNNGSSWTAWNGSTSYAAVLEIHVPYQQTDDALAYYGGAVSTGAYQGYRTYRSVEGGTQTDISPSYNSLSWGLRDQFSLKTCDADKNTVLMVGSNNTTGSGAPTVAHGGVWLARDGAIASASWTRLVDPPSSWRRIAIAGDDPDVFFFWGINGAIGVSYNGGVTIQDKSGNLGTFSTPSVGDVLNIFGGSG